MVAGIGLSSNMLPTGSIGITIIVIYVIWSQKVDMSTRSKRWTWVLALLSLVAVGSFRKYPNALTASAAVLLLISALYMIYRSGFTKSSSGWYERLHKARWLFYGLSVLAILFIIFMVLVAWINLQAALVG